MLAKDGANHSRDDCVCMYRVMAGNVCGWRQSFPVRGRPASVDLPLAPGLRWPLGAVDTIRGQLMSLPAYVSRCAEIGRLSARNNSAHCPECNISRQEDT